MIGNVTLKTNTRDKLLLQAEIQFAEKGFYGTSINDVAAELAISKQGLLHHFPSKEKLYAAVLQASADYLLEHLQQSRDQGLAPCDRLLKMMTSFSEGGDRMVRVVSLLMRELLDNRPRAEVAHQWFLKPVLDELEGVVLAGQEGGEFLSVHPLAFVYQLLGAIQYFMISQPTLKQLYSARRFNDHRKHHLIEIKRLINSAK